jgi:hypothetical protein
VRLLQVKEQHMNEETLNSYREEVSRLIRERDDYAARIRELSGALRQIASGEMPQLTLADDLAGALAEVARDALDDDAGREQVESDVRPRDGEPGWHDVTCGACGKEFGTNFRVEEIECPECEARRCPNCRTWFGAQS